MPDLFERPIGRIETIAGFFTPLWLIVVMVASTKGLADFVGLFVDLRHHQLLGSLLVVASLGGHFWLFNFVEMANQEKGYERGHFAGLMEAAERQRASHLDPRADESEPPVPKVGLEAEMEQWEAEAREEGYYARLLAEEKQRKAEQRAATIAKIRRIVRNIFVRRTG
jgi:hypothetical protein